MFGGWNIWQIVFLYALALIPKGLTELLFNGQWQLRLLVNRGEFDRLLVRPLSPALQVSTQVCGIHGLGSVLLGVIVLNRAAQSLHLSWAWWQYGIEFAKYPLTLYGRFLQILVTWVLPFAFVSYYPGLILLSQTGAQAQVGYLSPLAGPVMALVASVVWHRGLARYQGTGH